MRQSISFVLFALIGLVIAGCGAPSDESTASLPDTPEIGIESQALTSCYVSSIAFGTWYSQNDPSWKNQLLGNSSSDTIGNVGCVLASLATTYNDRWTTSTTPPQLNTSAKAAGCFAAGSPLIDVGCAINSRGGPHYVDDISMSSAATEICANHPVLVDVTWGAGHKMLVYGYNGGSTTAMSSYTVVDPWDGTSKALTTYSATRWRKLY